MRRSLTEGFRARNERIPAYCGNPAESALSDRCFMNLLRLSVPGPRAFAPDISESGTEAPSVASNPASFALPPKELLP